MVEYRIESDSLGDVRVPSSAYYGAQTQRAYENFPQTGHGMGREMIRSLGIVKWASAVTNLELGVLDKRTAEAIIAASREVIDGKFDDEFIVDVYQTGSGTSSHMNTNEVIANRAIELLGGKKGSRSPVHPNDHVNRCQSSNDVFPSAIHIAALEMIESDLVGKLGVLCDSLKAKATQFKDIIKIGRTHLQDAVPLTLGQEFSGYASQIEHGIQRLKNVLPYLRELPLGGTAVGTGLNAEPDFAEIAIQKICSHTGTSFVPVRNSFEAQASRDALVECSGQLKTVAVSLMKIANDLRWLSSGPRCGIGEISLPVLQPGSSIMPGKVNPVIPESVMMLCATVIGNDAAITVGGQHGNFELNTMMPMMAHHLLESIRLLSHGAKNLAAKCVDGIQANPDRLLSFAEQSLALATALTPHIGYDKASSIAKQAYKSSKTVREVVLEQKLFSAEELDEILNLRLLVDGGSQSGSG